jgi:two-component sensor histidine kinase
LSEVGSSWSEGLRQRLRQPTLWAAFGMAYVPYLAYLTWEGLAMSPHPNAWGWASRIFNPFYLFAGCVWLSPIPWEWAWPPGRSRSLWKGALAGFAFAETFVLIKFFLNLAFKLKAREDLDFLPGLLVNLCFLGPSTMLVGGALAYRNISDRERLAFQEQAEEAQTRLLQSQLHPHVLFNSLNGLAELVLKDPVRAERSIRALSDLLRKLLAASQSRSLPLRAERELVEDYLAMESMRLGERLQVDWDWDAAVDEHPVVPLLLQPLVENAIKHGVSPDLAGGRIRVEARIENDQLRLTVRNTGAPLTVGDGQGLGLTNLRFRLALAYGDAAVLQMHEAGGWTLAEVRIPLRHRD